MRLTKLLNTNQMMRARIIVLVSVFCLTLVSNAQTAKYVSAMKPYLGEWTQTSSVCTLYLRIEKSGAGKVIVKHKAVNHDGLNDMPFYTDYEKVEWTGHGFKCSYKSDNPDHDLLIVNTYVLKGSKIVATYYCYERRNGKYTKVYEQSEGEYHNW